MSIPTEPIGSIPRSRQLLEAMSAAAAGEISSEDLARTVDEAVRDTVRELEATGSPVVTDGEQAKPSFVTYPIAGLADLAPDGMTIPFADGHTRQLPRLTAGPFRYQAYAATYLEHARRYATVPVKQAVIAASALSLLYPPDGIDGYSREVFIDDLVSEAQADIRRALDGGAYKVQIDFTEGRLSLKLDTSKQVLRGFIALNNRVLSAFSDDELRRIGVHTCPGADLDSSHSLDIDYAELLPELFRLSAGNFYVQLASEADRPRVLSIIGAHLPPGRMVFVGVIDPIDPRVETVQEVRDRVIEAATYIPIEQLGTCDDCGFSPFGDDTSTSRQLAFAKIRARVEGTHLAAAALGL
jgi:5-methyltetrahydropteroyltriglutamate--homocysteine methyltransferase